MPISSITTEELQLMLEKNPSLQLIDVRSEEIFGKEGHIHQASLMPFDELLYAFRVLNPQEDVAVVCQDGVRSLDACYFLEAQGFDRLFHLKDGMSAWQGSLNKNIDSCKKFLNPSQSAE